ncbi:hypothetical protein MJI46_32980, partial [Salmonella enterica subsp. enterica serovar Cerro]|nr:hypothetical protein [Salmonella enterica subsp. enterica serovar Cerro]
MYHLRVPQTEEELERYYQFRWEMLRKPHDSYRQFGVSRAEFEKIIEFGIHSRKVLVKQAGGAVVVKMDLG